MSRFRQESEDFLRKVSLAAEWMMRRNAGATVHWWKSWVLTPRHTKDPDPTRPVYDDETARRIFAELKKRELLANEDVEGNTLPTDESDYPVHLMQLNVEGWDRVISDGRPLYGQWLKFRKTWPLILLSFILGGALDRGVDWAIEAATKRVVQVPEQPEAKATAPLSVARLPR